MGVAVGVDSHKSSLAVAVLDELGRLVGSREFSNDDGGHGALLEWIRGHDDNRVIGIEGTGNFGAALACRLIEANEDAREVPLSCPIGNVGSTHRGVNQISKTRLPSPGWLREERGFHHHRESRFFET
jgi:hypothetical protein